jgi:hypothetical protein
MISIDIHKKAISKIYYLILIKKKTIKRIVEYVSVLWQFFL